MSNFLNEIIELKKQRLALAQTQTPFADLKQKAFETRESSESHRLEKALSQAYKINVIAEIKRASPSKGVINDTVDIAETARHYESGGACAISVLTEEDKFKGSLKDLQTVRRAVDVPLLRKDFIFNEFQVYEAAEAGADAILLIAAMLDDEDLAKLRLLAERELKMDVLIEIHTLEELKRVEKIGAKIIGINNRNLHSFNVSLDVSRELIKYAPKNALLIAESGISSKEEIDELRELGFSGFLIGETLMRSGNAVVELKKLVENQHEKHENR